MSKVKSAPKSFSSVTPMVSNSKSRMYDKEFLYRMFHDHSDRNGVLLLTQQDLAAEADIPYQKVNAIINEFIEAGFMAKSGKNRSTRKFRVLYHPDDCDWDAFYDYIKSLNRKE